jgi:hypothetical protein
MFALWVLICANRREGWSAGWWIVFWRFNWSPKPVFPETYSHTAGNADTRVAMVFESVLQS